MNSLILLSFGFHILKKPIEKNLDAYKPTMGKNLLAQHSTTSAKKGILSLTMLYCTYMRKIELLSNHVRKLWLQ